MESTTSLTTLQSTSSTHSAKISWRGGTLTDFDPVHEIGCCVIVLVSDSPSAQSIPYLLDLFLVTQPGVK